MCCFDQRPDMIKPLGCAYDFRPKVLVWLFPMLCRGCELLEGQTIRVWLVWYEFRMASCHQPSYIPAWDWHPSCNGMYFSPPPTLLEEWFIYSIPPVFHWRGHCTLCTVILYLFCTYLVNCHCWICSQISAQSRANRSRFIRAQTFIFHTNLY